MRFGLFILFIISFHLHSQKKDSLEIFIDNSDYAALFLVGSGEVADSIMKVEINSDKLQAIVFDKSASSQTRFFSSEILFRYSPWNPDSSNYSMFARLYANAFKENYTVRGNPWGTTSGLGIIGKRMVLWKKESVKALLPLTRNTALMEFAGSHTVTLTWENEIRVKDIVAMCICEIIGHSFNIFDKPDERDIEIKKVRRLAKKHLHN